MQEKPRKLHGVDAIRVIAEFLVVRYHVLPHDERELSRGPIGMDIMCFFFVLSGFVMMYTFEHADFSTWRAVRGFWWDRVVRVYPVFLVNWLVWIPYMIKVWGSFSAPGQEQVPEPEKGDYKCYLRRLCPALQLVMLEGWAGCGLAYTVNGLSWFLSCLMWLWLVFPLIKDRLVDEFYRTGGSVWVKMLYIYLVAVGLVCTFWSFNIYTLCGLPFLRIGEFLIGCATACALRLEEPWWLANGRYWIPFAGVIAFYCLQRTDHGLGFLCLHEEAWNFDSCSVWHAGQAWVENKPPCITVLEKVLNKYALVWAALIYGVARAELVKGEQGFLQAEVFKTLSGFSLTLYLGHENMNMIAKGLGELPGVGWDKREWRDDTTLITVYSMCFALHYLMKTVFARLNPNNNRLLGKQNEAHGVEEGVELMSAVLARDPCEDALLFLLEPEEEEYY
jgi:peptidoglycan/LPS O-acetylase OafA/YrhL